MVLIEIVYCKITGKTRDLPKVHHFIPLEPWEAKKIRGNKKRMKSVVEITNGPNGGRPGSNNRREQIKLVLDMSNEGPMFKMLESMLGGAAGASKGHEALKMLLKSGIPGLEGFLKGGADGFAKMSDEDKKRFLAAVTGLGGKIDGKAAAALIAAAASGGDPEIANKIIEKMMSGLGDEIDPSMMAALMATTALVARGASNEEILAAMRKELANSGLSEEEILAKTMLLQKALAGDNSPAFVNKTIKSALSAAQISPNELAKVLIAEKAMSKAGVPPQILAEAMKLQKALADQGVPPSLIAEAIDELLTEAGGANLIPEMKNLLQSGISVEDINKIIALSKSFSSGKSAVDIPADLGSKEAIKAALKKVCNNDLDQFAKAVIAQKAMAVSGATPEQVAKVAFLTKSMAENGMSINEIANALTMALYLPDGASTEFIQELETFIHETLSSGQGLSDQDIQMLLALSEAMTSADGLVPPEAVRLFKKAMKQRRGSVDNVAETLMSSLTASGESKENVAKAMVRALKATGASPEEIAKTMHQALEKAGASPEEMAKVLAQALAESGASPEEIAKVLKATFAKAMASNPNAAADLARSMAEALAATGASADEIAATLQDALNASLCNADPEHLDELLDVADTVARSMAEAGASPEEIASAMKAAFAAAGKADDPFVAEELAISMAKALASAGASPEEIVKALQESLKATGASKEEIARTLLTAIATSGVDPEDIAKTMQSLLADSGLSDEEIKEKVLQSMIEAGATPEAIAKVMVQQEILNAIGKSPDDMSKQLLKQLRSGDEITLDDLKKLLKSGGVSLEDAGSVILLQKALSVFNDVPPDEIARAILLLKGLIDAGALMEDVLEMLNTVVKESGVVDMSNFVDLEQLTTNAISTDHVMTALQLDKVLEAGGVTLDGLRQDNADKKSVSDALKEMLHSNGATPKGLIATIILQKIMSSLNLAPDAMAKMILLEKSLYDAGTSPQDIVQLLQTIANDQKVNLITMEPLMKKSLMNPNADAKGVLATCDLVDAFRGAKVAPEITSKIIMLQKAIESGIVSPESTVQDLSEKLKENGVNPADFLDAFNDVLKKNDVGVADMGKAALIIKASAGTGLDPVAFATLLDIQNCLVDAGLNEDDIAKVLNELVKNEDLGNVGKAMIANIEGHNRLREDELALCGRLADAIDKSAAKSSKVAKLLSSKKDLAQMALPELVALLGQILTESKTSPASLAKALSVQALMANSNCDPDKLAKAMRITNALVRNGVTKSNVARLIHEGLEENPTARRQASEDVRKPLKDLKAILANPSWVSFLQKYQTAMTESCTKIDNLKEIFENAMNVVGLSREDVARAAMVQKTLSASGVTPAVLAQAVLFQRALSASGLSPEEIVGVLAKVTSPKFSEEEISLLLAKVLEKKSVSKEDIEAISKMQKALRDGNMAFGSDDPTQLSEELQHLIASGEVDMEILGKAVLMQKILSASGLSPEDLGKAILLQQGMLDAGASPEGIASCLHKTLMESDISLDQLAALMQLGLLQSNSLCPDDVRNTLMFDKVLGAAQAAKIIARKIKPEQMKLLEAAVSATKEGGGLALINAMKKALGDIIDPVSLQAMEVSAVMADAGASKEEIEEMMALLLSQGTVSADFIDAVKDAMTGGGSPAERLAALKAAVEEEVNSVGAALRNTFMNKIPTADDIRQTCNALANKLNLDEASRTECKLALVDLLDEALQDVTIYEPDGDMIFNYLMVSALADATEIIEKKNLHPTGGMLEELAREYMISMLERLCQEADVDTNCDLFGCVKEAKTLAELQEALRNLMNDAKIGGAFKRQVAFLFDFEEIEHTTVAGLAMQDILKDAKHKLRPWELNKHRKIRGLRRAKVPQLTYSQVYCFYKVLPKHTDGPTIGFDYE